MTRLSAPEARRRIASDPELERSFQRAVMQDREEEEAAERSGYVRPSPEGAMDCMTDYFQTMMGDMMMGVIGGKLQPGDAGTMRRVSLLENALSEAAVLAGVINACDQSPEPFEIAARNYLTHSLA